MSPLSTSVGNGAPAPPASRSSSAARHSISSSSTGLGASGRQWSRLRRHSRAGCSRPEVKIGKAHIARGHGAYCTTTTTGAGSIPSSLVSSACRRRSSMGSTSTSRSVTAPGALSSSSTALVPRSRAPAADRPFRARCEVSPTTKRGLGRTAVPPGPYPWPTTGRHRGPARPRRLAHLRGRRREFGGMVAQEFAVTWPRVDAWPWCAPRRAAPTPRRIRCTRSPISTRPSGPRWRCACSTPASRPNGWRRTSRIGCSPSSWPNAPRRRRTPTPRGAREQLPAPAGHDVRDRLERITCPTFVAAGRYDGIAPTANAEAIVARVPDADAARLRGRPRVLRAGPGRDPGCDRLPHDRVGPGSTG